MGEQFVDRDGFVYEKGWDGEYHQKEGLFGSLRRTDTSGNPAIETDWQGNPKVKRDWQGNEVTSSDGRTLFRPGPTNGFLEFLFVWTVYLVLVIGFIIAWKLLGLTIRLLVLLVRWCFVAPKVALPVVGGAAAIIAIGVMTIEPPADSSSLASLSSWNFPWSRTSSAKADTVTTSNRQLASTVSQTVPTVQAVSSPTFVVNTWPVGCHREPSVDAAVVTNHAPGAVQAMDAFIRQSDGTWFREVKQQCWTRTDPGPVEVFGTLADAERLAAKLRMGLGASVRIGGVGTGECVNLRAQPGTSARVLTCLPANTALVIQEGPQDASGRRWWKVDRGGWVAEEFLQSR